LIQAPRFEAGSCNHNVRELIGTTSVFSVAHGDADAEESILPFQAFSVVFSEGFFSDVN